MLILILDGSIITRREAASNLDNALGPFTFVPEKTEASNLAHVRFGILQQLVQRVFNKFMVLGDGCLAVVQQDDEQVLGHSGTHKLVLVFDLFEDLGHQFF